jgi:two-component system, OmpR family, sensor histidine kinase BaeS
MLSSIFQKWLAAYLAITFIGIIILTATISWLVQRDIYRQGLNQLSERALAVEQTFEQYKQGDMPLTNFRKDLKSVEQENGVRISIIGKRVKYLKKDLMEVGVRPDVLSWVNSVSDGNRIEKITKFRNQDEEKMLIVGFPLKANGNVLASAFVYSPITNVEQIAAPIRRTIWMIALISTGPLILLLWLATRRLVKPLTQLSQAAQLVADGDFTSRVRVNGNDEVARLGSSFNWMAERIQRIEDQRRRLIMELSHELRTPLTSIRATLQALSDGIISAAEQKEFIDLSLVESQRLGNLIDDLQELSAFEEHQIQFHFKQMDLTELVELTVLQFQHQAEQSGKRLMMETDRSIPFMMKADPERLKQVLINVIGNALGHNKGGTTVIVRLYSHQQKAKLIVQDNGPGISEEHLPRLFDRLYKAESSRSTKGSGVGLTISRYIINAHGGDIRAVSEVGKGTEIQIELPLHPS